MLLLLWLTVNNAVLESSGSDARRQYARSTRQAERSTVVRLVSTKWTLRTWSQAVDGVRAWSACHYKHAPHAGLYLCQVVNWLSSSNVVLKENFWVEMEHVLPVTQRTASKHRINSLIRLGMIAHWPQSFLIHGRDVNLRSRQLSTASVPFITCHICELKQANCTNRTFDVK